MGLIARFIEATTGIVGISEPLPLRRVSAKKEKAFQKFFDQFMDSRTEYTLGGLGAEMRRSGFSDADVTAYYETLSMRNGGGAEK